MVFSLTARGQRCPAFKQADESQKKLELFLFLSIRQLIKRAQTGGGGGEVNVEHLGENERRNSESRAAPQSETDAKPTVNFASLLYRSPLVRKKKATFVVLASPGCQNIKSHHHSQVTHVELRNAGHQGLFVLLHHRGNPPEHILVLAGQNATKIDKTNKQRSNTVAQ